MAHESMVLPSRCNPRISILGHHTLVVPHSRDSSHRGQSSHVHNPHVMAMAWALPLATSQRLVLGFLTPVVSFILEKALALASTEGSTLMLEQIFIQSLVPLPLEDIPEVT